MNVLKLTNIKKNPIHIKRCVNSHYEVFMFSGGGVSFGNCTRNEDVDVNLLNIH